VKGVLATFAMLASQPVGACEGSGCGASFSVVGPECRVSAKVDGADVEMGSVKVLAPGLYRQVATSKLAETDFMMVQQETVVVDCVAESVSVVTDTLGGKKTSPPGDLTRKDEVGVARIATATVGRPGGSKRLPDFNVELSQAAAVGEVPSVEAVRALAQKHDLAMTQRGWPTDTMIVLGAPMDLTCGCRMAMQLN